MLLREIYKQLLKEQVPLAPAPMPAPQPALGGNMSAASQQAQPGAPIEGANIVELKDVNTVISLFPMEKKLVFSMQEHTSYTNKLKLYVDVLKQNFRISSIKNLDEGIFEMVFDPREDFGSVIQFLQPKLSTPNDQGF